MSGDLEVPSSLAIGSRIGHIRILELLGKGGMGEVYIGSDEALQRRVAVKAIRPDCRLAKPSRARFLREARMLSQLDHPNICRIYDYIQGKNNDFLVLELVEGNSLSDAVINELNVTEKLSIAIQIAGVLEAAHGKGIVHRDLKPQNVMLTQNMEVKVLDFGLARSEDPSALDAGGLAPVSNASPAPDHIDGAQLVESSDDTKIKEGSENTTAHQSECFRTQHGQLVGTIAYMSPEQANSQALTTASDMYSYGLLLQTLFSSVPAHPEGQDPATILQRAQRGDTLPPTGLDADLGKLIERLKSKAPAARPTAVEALARLRWIHQKPKRRLRRGLAAAGAVLVSVAAIKYTVDLRRARDEADSRRAQAEGLIGFMIGDLRTKLAPANRLEVLDDIGDEALDYFQTLPASRLTDDELLFRSRTLSQIGQVRMDQGNLTAALQAFDQSLALAEGLVEREPQRNEWRAELGAAHFWIGNVFWSRGQLDRALESFRNYLIEAQKLVQNDPKNLDWQMELSYAHNNIGSILAARGDIPEASKAFRTSLEIKEPLVARQPTNTDWQAELASTHSWLAETLRAQGLLEQALHHSRTNQSILQELSGADPTNNRLRWLLGVAHERLGSILVDRGLLEQAENHFELSLGIHQELVMLDTANSTWQRDLALIHRRMGDYALDVGHHEEARKEMQNSKTILEALLVLDESNTDWRNQLGFAHVGLARAQRAIGSMEDALESARRAVEISDTIAQNDQEAFAPTLLRGEAHLILGELLSQSGRSDAANASFLFAMESIEPHARLSDDPVKRDAWARALLQLDQIQEALPVVERLHREGYRHPRFVNLCWEKGIWPG